MFTSPLAGRGRKGLNSEEEQTRMSVQPVAKPPPRLGTPGPRCQVTLVPLRAVPHTPAQSPGSKPKALCLSGQHLPFSRLKITGIWQAQGTCLGSISTCRVQRWMGTGWHRAPPQGCAPFAQLLSSRGARAGQSHSQGAGALP